MGLAVKPHFVELGHGGHAVRLRRSVTAPPAGGVFQETGGFGEAGADAQAGDKFCRDRMVDPHPEDREVSSASNRATSGSAMHARLMGCCQAVSF
jgi:hypothetical protein